MKIIKNLNDFIKESVEIKDNREFNNIIKILEEYGYSILNISKSEGFGGSLYFEIEGEHAFTLSYSDQYGTNLCVIVELEDGTEDSLGCFNVHDNIVKTITDVIISYCEQTIEE